MLKSALTMDQFRLNRQLPLLILILILAFLAVLKASFNPYPIGEFSTDGSYYYQMARHVADGQGLLTSVSAYRMGHKTLPYPSPGYPFWPVVLGWCGRLIGLEKAATLLPGILFITSLIFLYILTNRITAAWGSPVIMNYRGTPIVDVGHVAILLFGLNAIYFKFTSLPFTEGLAFTLLFAALLSLSKALEHCSIPWAGAAGLCAALSYLTRYQLLGVVIVVPATLFVAAIFAKRYLRSALIASVVASVPIATWFIHLSSYYGGFRPAMLLDVAAPRLTPELPPDDFIVRTASLFTFVSDRLRGAVFVAFSPGNPYSYVHSFGYAAYLPLIAIVYAALRFRRLPNIFRRLAEARCLMFGAAVVTAALCLTPVHAMHATRYGGWFFGFRQGLPFILAVVISIGFLLTRPHLLVRVAVGLVLLLSIVSNASSVRHQFTLLPTYRPPTAAEVGLGEWIKSQPSAPVFMTTEPYVLGGLTTGLFHAVLCREPAEQVNVYFDVIRVTHVIVRVPDRRCEYFTNVQDRLDLVQSFGAGVDQIDVWRVRRPTIGEN